MGRRLLTLDASRGCVVVACGCGFRGLALTRSAARTIADRHRAEAHPRQATYVASKRRSRARTQSAVV